MHNNTTDHPTSNLNNIRAHIKNAEPIRSIKATIRPHKETSKNIAAKNIAAKNIIVSHSSISETFVPENSPIPETSVPENSSVPEKQPTDITLPSPSPTTKTPGINTLLDMSDPLILQAAPLLSFFPISGKANKQAKQPDENSLPSQTTQSTQEKLNFITSNKTDIVTRLKKRVRKNIFHKIVGQQLEPLKKYTKELIPTYGGSHSKRFLRYLKNGRGEYAHKLFSSYTRSQGKKWNYWLKMEQNSSSYQKQNNISGKTGDKAHSVGIIFSKKDKHF